MLNVSLNGHILFLIYRFKKKLKTTSLYELKKSPINQ